MPLFTTTPPINVHVHVPDLTPTPSLAVTKHRATIRQSNGHWLKEYRTLSTLSLPPYNMPKRSEVSLITLVRLVSSPLQKQNGAVSSSMVCFCFLVDQTRQVQRSKPAAGICSRCGGGASVADMKTATRFCCVPFYWKSWRALVCTLCGAVLRSY